MGRKKRVPPGDYDLDRQRAADRKMLAGKPVRPVQGQPADGVVANSPAAEAFIPAGQKKPPRGVPQDPPPGRGGGRGGPGPGPPPGAEKPGGRPPAGTA